ncbi:MAG TPA: polyprenyl diphosphate synthase, partial [Novosphingobium sp.]
IEADLDEFHANGVRLRIIGNYQVLDPSLVKLIEDAVARTAANSGPIIAIALNYGAQDELVRAAQRLAQRVESGEIKAADINVEHVEAGLDTAGLPPLDLLIRTSGEQRLSNFMLWQAAYAELYFTDTLWPDFDRHALAAALDAFRLRDRRFGGL